MICNLLAAEGLASHRIPIGGCTRRASPSTRPAPTGSSASCFPDRSWTVAEQTECLLQLRHAAADKWSIVVASGSLPPGVPPDFYQQVANVCTELGVTFLLDTSGGGLTHVNSGVSLLGPSVRELRGVRAGHWRPRTNNWPPPVNSSSAGRPGTRWSHFAPQAPCWSAGDRAQRFAAVPVTIPPGGSGVGAGDAMLAACRRRPDPGWPVDEAASARHRHRSRDAAHPGNGAVHPGRRRTAVPGD